MHIYGKIIFSENNSCRNVREVKATVPSLGSLSAPTASSPQETVNLDSSFAPAASPSVESANGVYKAPLGVSAQTNTGSNGFDPRGSVSGICILWLFLRVRKTITFLVFTVEMLFAISELCNPFIFQRNINQNSQDVSNNVNIVYLDK